MTHKLKLAELTSEEARRALTADSFLILPMGSLEDQGTHAPMGDYLFAEALALDVVRAARTEGLSAFMPPVIPFGGADYFGSSHGGVALSHATLTALLDDMIAGFLRHGLNRIFILNGHGGNVAPINEVTMRWRQSHGVMIPALYLWQAAGRILQQELGAEAAELRGGHGADPLTSIGQHYRPELQRADLRGRPAGPGDFRGMTTGPFNHVTYDGIDIQFPIEAAETAPDGIWNGDPALCSPETGRLLAERLTRVAVGFMRDHMRDPAYAG
ncbi:creatininase family protein [Ferrimonas balearica]|nr:creatininase family protein [Ferrimonas balearica]